ncbi:MAG: hypothetical protein HZA20_03865 [Nitrospirae bacterium]|nr:hypothetical protein [Nitrospirota bacterium]
MSIDNEIMNRLIKAGKVDLDTLKSARLDSTKHYEYLFIHDHVSLEEAAAYMRVAKMTVYRKVWRHKKPSSLPKHKKRQFPSSPIYVFKDPDQYIDFLGWRSHSFKKQERWEHSGVSVAKAAKILNCSARYVNRMARDGKLSNGTDGGIMWQSLRMHLLSQKQKLEEDLRRINNELERLKAE